MQFIKLTIERHRWGDLKDKITAELEIEGITGKQTLIIQEPASLEIMRSVADIVASEGAKAAAAFRQEFLDSVSGKLIEVGS
jgi:hypothetical protein